MFKRILLAALALLPALTWAAVATQPTLPTEIPATAQPLDKQTANSKIRYFYAQCTELPKTAHTINLKYTKKPALAAGSKKVRDDLDFVSALSKKRNVCVLLAHPEPKESIVVQVIFKETYAFVVLHGLTSSCPQPMVDLTQRYFAPKGSWGRTIGIGFFAVTTTMAVAMTIENAYKPHYEYNDKLTIAQNAKAAFKHHEIIKACVQSPMKLEKFTTIEDFDLPSEAPADQCMASQEWQKANESKIKTWIFEDPRETILIMTSTQHERYGKHLQDCNTAYLGNNVLERLAYRILVLNDTDNTLPEKSKNFEICWDIRPCNEIKNDLTGSLLTVSMQYYGTYKNVLNHSSRR